MNKSNWLLLVVSLFCIFLSYVISTYYKKGKEEGNKITPKIQYIKIWKVGPDSVKCYYMVLEGDTIMAVSTKNN